MIFVGANYAGRLSRLYAALKHYTGSHVYATSYATLQRTRRGAKRRYLTIVCTICGKRDISGTLEHFETHVCNELAVMEALHLLWKRYGQDK